ncbi:hypothetical protein ACFVKB_15450 [Rhodococcus sp. NPDC127530]|uniref:hypothetical protein n=1 Tax=unclassified Rhodococcus (in: high G+C Gram-positive bacteria) TaxID=192944 RepID=UPI003637A820
MADSESGISRADPDRRKDDLTAGRRVNPIGEDDGLPAGQLTDRSHHSFFRVDLSERWYEGDALRERTFVGDSHGEIVFLVVRPGTALSLELLQTAGHSS